MPSVVAVEGVLGIQLVHCGTLFGPKINPRQPMINARQPTGNLGAILGRLGAVLGSSWSRLGCLGAVLKHLEPSWGHLQQEPNMGNSCETFESSW